MLGRRSDNFMVVIVQDVSAHDGKFPKITWLELLVQEMKFCPKVYISCK